MQAVQICVCCEALYSLIQQRNAIEKITFASIACTQIPDCACLVLQVTVKVYLVLVLTWLVVQDSKQQEQQHM